MKPITAEQAAEAAKGLNFEKVWAALMETREHMEESYKRMEERMQESDKRKVELDMRMEESYKRMEESLIETRRLMQESQNESQKKLDALAKNVGDVNNAFGRFTESLFSVGLDTMFDEHGYTFSRQGPHYKFREKGTRRILAEADYFLEDGDYAMVVEVKTELKQADVDDHINRIAVIRRHFDERGDKRLLVGAVAGGIVHKNALDHALKNGLYVITQSGDSAVLAELPEGFKAREW